MIGDNINEVRSNIAAALQRANRSDEDVTLIAVSKTKPVSAIDEAMKYGVTDFGENKVQELTDKYGQLPSNIKWHLIGHLQRNKVKYIIEKVDLIHSVDSLRLAEEIAKEAKKKNLIARILIQVNVAEEDSKFGLSVENTEELIRIVSKLEHIKIVGLMTIAPFTENPEENRLYFRELRKLFVDIKQKNIDNVNMEVLSMGMSGDYEVAIEEGATMVRVGTNIFGDRIYPN